MYRQNIDTVIIGQGLAGSLLAWELFGRGEKILVVDDEHASASSTAAAGLINPVTGQRLVKTVGADKYLPLAQKNYRALEALLDTKLLFEKKMWRLLRRDTERQVWLKRKQDTAYDEYLGEWLDSSQLQPPFHAPLGGFVQQHTGYLDTRALLDGIREWLIGQGCYRSQHIEYGAIKLEGDDVNFDGISCRRVIFCEGYKAMHNPWFNWLPFTPAKGEILSLRFNQNLPDVMINAGRWLMPRENGEHRLGATYEHEPLDEVNTDEARQTLLAALPEILTEPGEYTVTGQQAGVRPATQDRQPFIGVHPEYPQLGIFNGFGSKGSLLIPWHADVFADALRDNRLLPEECDIHRYIARYSSN